MNILLIGSGGREHALAWKLRQSPRLDELYALPGSDGMASLAEPLGGDPLDFPRIVELCKKNSVDLVVVGPEAPLAVGIADALAQEKIPVFGPGRKAAALEASKAFAKDFLRRHRVPTARYESFSDPAAARLALKRDFRPPVVVKADGLAAGKGVRVCRSADEAEAAVQDFMVLEKLGEAGRRVVLEECLVGQETSFLGFCDGKTLLALPPSSDHKRLLDGDQGPNTGGMGVFAPTPAVTPELMARIRSEIIDPVLSGLKADKLPYCGILYCGLMLTAARPKVLEFNVRFGDPETQAVLPLLQSDLLELMEATTRGELSSRRISWKGASVCVVLASQGYPDKPAVGKTITGLDTRLGPDVLVFHAGTKQEGNTWKTAGGRVLGVTAVGPTLGKAREKAYAAAERIRFDGVQYRKDIAAPREKILGRA